MQKEFILAKPARDAAAKAQMEAEASAGTTECPIHTDNEWNIRYCYLEIIEIFVSILVLRSLGFDAVMALRNPDCRATLAMRLLQH